MALCKAPQYRESSFASFEQDLRSGGWEGFPFQWWTCILEVYYLGDRIKVTSYNQKVASDNDFHYESWPKKKYCSYLIWVIYSQCSRLKPSYEFHFEGLSNINLTVSWRVRFKSKTFIWEYSNEIKELIWNSCMNYTVHISSTMWRIKNQSSYSTSCSDNSLRLVVVVCGQIVSRTSSDIFIFILGLRFGGLFWEMYILKGQIAFKGHWRLQSWTLVIAEDGVGGCPSLHDISIHEINLRICKIKKKCRWIPHPYPLHRHTFRMQNE